MKKILLTTVLWAICMVAYPQQGLNFDGIDDVVVTGYAGIGGNGARTVEAWIRTTAVSDPNQGGNQRVIVDWGSMSPNGSRFTFNMTWANSIRIEVGGNGISGTQAINDGNWHHLAVSYDPTATSNQMKLYIDGVMHTQGNTTVAVNTNNTSGLPLRIGRRVDGINGFNGDIDEVRVWNVVRTDAEIAANMNSEFCALPTGLVAYYKFNQGSPLGNNTGLITLIEEVAGNNGTLENFALLGPTSNWITGANIGNGTVQGPTITASSCGPYVAPSGTVLSTSGMYSDTLVSVDGCDSILAIDLTVINIDLAVSISSNILTANQAGASYQWLDCNDLSEIPGATSQFYIATQNGFYAAAITKDGCTDTTSCYIVEGIGVPDFSEFEYALYPNPSKGDFKIQFSKVHASVHIEIVDLSGRVFFSNQYHNSDQIEIRSELPKGVYLIRIAGESGVHVLRHIVL